MKWFWRYVWRRMRDISDEPQDPSGRISKASLTVGNSSTFDADNGLNMRVFKAIGGRIVCFNHYDRKTDRESRAVYIITDDQDFERELGKIITMESMRG